MMEPSATPIPGRAGNIASFTIPSPKRKARRHAAPAESSAANKAQNEAVLKLPPNLPALPLEDAAAINQMFRETVNHFRQGEMDLRSANCIRNFGLAMLRGLEFEMRTQREASRAAAPRTLSDKKLPLPVRVIVRDIVTGELYQVPNQKGHSAAKPPSPSQPDPKENEQDQGRHESISREFAASAQNQTEAQTKDQTEAQQPAKAQQLNEQKEPQPNGTLPGARPRLPSSPSPLHRKKIHPCTTLPVLGLAT
jgi:hypothetical protein